MINQKVLIIMGSENDFEIMKKAIDILNDFNIPYEVVISSAHRSPDKTRNICRKIENSSIEVVIAGAGGSAHLAGVIASEIIKPVIGVPISSSPLKGIDALYSTVQMPPGVPVATVGVDSSANAAILAVEILSLKDSKLKKKLKEYRKNLVKKIEEQNKKLSI